MHLNSGIRVTLAAYLGLCATSQAAESQYEIGLRGVGLLGDGVPANDIIGFGVDGRYYLRDGWFVAGALETFDYDFERPIEVIGLRQDPDIKTIDATISTTVLSAHLGRLYDFGNERFDWYWTLGMGVGFPDATSVTGPTSTGGTFDVATDTGTEIHLMGALGLSFLITPNLALNAAARAEHHFIDFNVVDRVSGNTGQVDSQSPLGMNFGISWRF